jgi:hypothetical protein
VSAFARLKPARAGFIVALAFAFLALHLPYVPASLEDLDSINFALGLHSFDVARHRPHPPGYPVFIVLARGARRIASSDVGALSGVSIAAGAAGVLAIAWLFVELARRGSISSPLKRSPEGFALQASALAVTAPLYWLTSARPLSDSAGLTAAIAVQALTLRARTPPMLALAAFLAGAAVGIRSQVFWLTLPLIALRGRGIFPRTPGRRLPTPLKFPTPLFGLVMGIFVWFIPLLAVSGGPVGYWRAVSAQGEADLSGITMLWTSPGVRELIDAFYFAFVAPWAVWPIALVILIAAAAGVAIMWKRDRSTLAVVAAAFGPYLAFDVLFQETFTSRYALPMIVPLAFFAAQGIRLLPPNAAAIVCIAIAMLDAHVGGRSLAAYARQPAPAFAMLADMRQAAIQSGPAPVLAPDRRQSLDLRRPLLWMGAEAPRFARQLAAPPQHEWLQAVTYWNADSRAPIWFVVDPRRAAMSFVQHGDPIPYRLLVPQPVLLSGTRPADMDWYRVERPDWYVGEGWALSPEAAGVADVDRRGLRYGSIDGWIRSAALDGGALVIGGRNFDPTAAGLTATAGEWSTTLAATPGFFVHMVRLPRSAAPSPGDYVKLTLSAPRAANVAIEQFDASTNRAVLGFGPGWFEPELDPQSGVRWRWLGERAELKYMNADSGSSGWMLHLEGESPRKYYPRNSRLVVRSGPEALVDMEVGADFTIDVPVPSVPAGALAIETDQTHVPAESGWRRSADRRRLGLRIFRCELRPRASGPGTRASSPPAR